MCRYCVDTGYRHWQTGSWQLVPGFLGAPGSGSAGEAVAGDTSVYNTTCCEHNPGLFTAQLVVSTSHHSALRSSWGPRSHTAPWRRTGTPRPPATSASTSAHSRSVVGGGCIVTETSLTPSSGPDQGSGDQRQSGGDGRDPRPLRLHAARVPHGEY